MCAASSVEFPLMHVLCMRVCVCLCAGDGSPQLQRTDPGMAGGGWQHASNPAQGSLGT